jgi:hypothetical protein
MLMLLFILMREYLDFSDLVSLMFGRNLSQNRCVSEVEDKRTSAAEVAASLALASGEIVQADCVARVVEHIFDGMQSTRI